MTGSVTRFVIPVYPGTTQLDFTAPHQFFSRVPGAEVIVASRAGGTLELDGLTFAELPRLADVPSCDVLCVPGGFGTVDAIHDDAFIHEIRRLAGGARFVTSVCTGSIVLAAAGLLRGKRAACHWFWRELLGRFPEVTVDPARVVRDGNVITGGGVTAGIDFGLQVAAELAGEAVAKALQLMIEYDPAPPFDSGHPRSADPAVLAALKERMGPMQTQRAAQVDAAAARLG